MPTNTTPAQPKKLLDQVRDKIRFKHYSLSTENTYISWIKQYILFHGKRHPTDMGAIEVERFLPIWRQSVRYQVPRKIKRYRRYNFYTAKYWQSICPGWMVSALKKTTAFAGRFFGD